VITVRFPNGQAIRYNHLTWCSRENDGSVLLKKEQSSGWSVMVPRECIIEFTQPCSVSNPLLSPKESIDLVIDHIREMDAAKLRQLKTLLEDFNRHTFRWKE
jgi:hypothetical protein